MNLCELCRRRIRNPVNYYVLDCEHEFHQRCLIMYFHEHPYTCPICNERVSRRDRDILDQLEGRVVEADLYREDSGYSSDSGIE